MPAPSATVSRFLGVGVYTPAEAERLTKIPRKRIRRWMEGYTDARHSSAPVLFSDLGREPGILTLTFADMIEVRFLDAFRQHGLKWSTIRAAAEVTAEILNTSRPFSSRAFMTDGNDILLDVVHKLGPRRKSRALLNLAKNQWELRGVVRPVLHGVEFGDGDEPNRWWPLGRRRKVVIDPARAFGQPIVATRGIPTSILAAAAHANGSQRLAAQLFEASEKEVRDAVEFERHYAA